MINNTKSAVESSVTYVAQAALRNPLVAGTVIGITLVGATALAGYHATPSIKRGIKSVRNWIATHAAADKDADKKIIDGEATVISNG